jgi:hypothetical protein
MPAAVVGDVGVRTVLEQVLADDVILVVGGGEERGPAVVRFLVDVRPGFDESFDRFKIAFASREDQCGHTTAVLDLVAVAEEFRGIGDIIAAGDATFGCVLRAIGEGGSSTTSAAATPCTIVVAPELIAVCKALCG